jgi:hypothetical protein
VITLSRLNPKALFWRLFTNLSPLPVLAKPRTADAWQRHWQERDSDQVFRGYAQVTPLRTWLAAQIIALAPRSVVELGCNVGGNLQALWQADPSLRLHGVELGAPAADWGRRHLAGMACPATLLVGSMGNAGEVLAQAGVTEADVVFTAAAAMHVDDALFAKAKRQSLSLARRAIVHLEYNAWTPAEMANGRKWRSSFLSDRWVRDYVAEYEGTSEVAGIDCMRIPPSINVARPIGRLSVNDTTALVIVHLRAR